MKGVLRRLLLSTTVYESVFCVIILFTAHTGVCKESEEKGVILGFAFVRSSPVLRVRSLSLVPNDFHNKVPQLIALSSVCFDFTKFLLLPPSQVTSKVNSKHFHSCWCYTATVSSIWLDVVSYLHIDLVLRWFHHRQLRVRVLLWSTRCCEALLRHSSQHAVPHLLLQRWLGQR